MTANSQTIRSTRILAAVLMLVLSLVLLGSAVAADQASAQGLSFCDQYPTDPECDLGPLGPLGPLGDSGNEGPDTGPLSGNALGNGDGDNLPFTGYPLSPLIMLLLVLLTAGFALRGYLTVRDRLAARNSLS